MELEDGEIRQGIRRKSHTLSRWRKMGRTKKLYNSASILKTLITNHHTEKLDQVTSELIPEQRRRYV